MRILLTTDVVGGVWTYTEELVDALRRRGHELALVALGGEPGPAQRAWLDTRPEVPCTVVDCPLEWSPDPEPGLSQSLEPVQRAVEAAAPDVIHLNQFYYGAFDLGAPTLVVAHSDVVGWWRTTKNEPPPRDAWFERYRGWVECGLEGADVRAAPSAAVAEQVEEIYGAGPVRVVHNARSPGRFANAARPNDQRAARVVAAGRLWDEAKGARELIPAAERLGGQAEVVVAGAVEHPGGGEDFPTDTPGVRWAGVLEPDELAALFGGARVYAATSRYEPFGLAPLEAALAGCTLVATDIPTFRELWDGCARFYPPGEPRALADRAGELLEDEPTRRALADAARTRALECFSPDRMAAEYEALYQELCTAETDR